ncbi:MAG: hypothetical protein KIS67_14835 [Verrucomicrobiae bacterium]|nr:hypothetical protein [Verrucomicrobiae bacterium]
MKNQIVLKSFDQLSQIAAQNGQVTTATQSATRRTEAQPGANPAASGRAQPDVRRTEPTHWRGCPAEAEAWSG